MEWKLSDDRPIWLQLSEQLARQIVSGVYPPGGKLPSVRELAADAGVNPNTMQRALSQLESEGLAVSNRTAGRMVTEDASVIDAARRKMAREIITTFFAAMADLGLSRERAIELLKEEGIHE